MTKKLISWDDAAGSLPAVVQADLDAITDTKIADERVTERALQNSTYVTAFKVGKYGAIGDGTTDDTAAIQAAIDAAYAAGGGTVIGTPGLVYGAVGLIGKDKVSFKDLYLKKISGDQTTTLLSLLGAVTATTQAVTVDAAAGATALTVADSTAFAVGDRVLIFDLTYKWSTFGRNQEINRVTATGAGSITLANKTMASYAVASTATVTKLAAITAVAVDGCTFEMPLAGRGALLVGILNVGTQVTNSTAIRPYDTAGIYFEQSTGVRVDRCLVRDGQDQATGGNGYGASFSEATTHSTITNCTFENIRENSFTNNTRHCSFVGNTIRGAYDSAFNTHASGNTSIIISDNIVSDCRQYGIASGFSTGNATDTDVLISGNVVSNCASTGINVGFAAGARGKRIKVVNNVVRNCAMTGTAYGIAAANADQVQISGNLISGNGNATYGVFLSAVTYCDIRANTVADHTAAYGIGYSASDRITVDGNTLINNASYNVRSVGGTSTNVVVSNNVADDASIQLGATDIARGNSWDVATSTTAALIVVTNLINVNGKFAGKMVYNTTTKKPVWADAATAAGVWVDATGATAHTPV